MQIKITMRYHCIPIRMAKGKIVKILIAGEDVEKLDHHTLQVGI